MKKQKKQLIVLLVLMVLAIGAWQGLKKYNAVQAEKEEAASKVDIVAAEPDDIRSITVTNANGTFALSYDGSNWTFADAGTVSTQWAADAAESGTEAEATVTDPTVTDTEVNATKASTLAANLENVTGTQEIKSVTDFSIYGLDGATSSVSFTLEDGTEHTLTFGDYNDTASVYYVRLDESDSVFTVNSSFYTVYNNLTAADLVEQETEAVTEAATEEVTEASTEAITEALSEGGTETTLE